MNPIARLRSLAMAAVSAMVRGPMPPTLPMEAEAPRPSASAALDLGLRQPPPPAALPPVESTITTGAVAPYGSWQGWEHRAENAPHVWPLVAQEMLRDDPVLYGAHRALREYQASEEWWFDGHNAQSEAYGGLLNEAFGFGCAGRLRESWDAQLKMLQPAVEHGHALAETAYYIADDRVWLDRLLPIDPYQVVRWETDRRSRQLRSIALRGSAPLPADKAAIFVHDRVGLDYWGRSVLRACWPWYVLKKHVLWLIGGGCERWALPTPLVDIDRRVATELNYSTTAIAEMIGEAKRVAAAYAAGRSAYLVQNPAVSMKVFGAGREFRPEALLEVVRVCDSQMLNAWAAQHAQVGTGDIGSKSAGEIHEGAFRVTASSLNDGIGEVFGGRMGPGRGIAERLLRYNVPGFNRGDMPVLRHWGLLEPAVMKLVPHIPHLVGAGALTPDPELERALRGVVALAMGTAANRSAEERLGQPNNLVANPGPQITPDGMPANVKAAAARLTLAGRHAA